MDRPIDTIIIYFMSLYYIQIVRYFNIKFRALLGLTLRGPESGPDPRRSPSGVRSGPFSVDKLLAVKFNSSFDAKQI